MKNPGGVSMSTDELLRARTQVFATCNGPPRAMSRSFFTDFGGGSALLEQSTFELAR